MVNTFKANMPHNNFLLFVYGFVLKLSGFIHPVAPVSLKDDGILYKFLLTCFSFLGISSPIVFSIISFLLLFVLAISINTLVNNQRLLPKPNYLAGMGFLLVTSMFPDFFSFSSVLLVSALLTWMLAKIFTLYNNNNPKTTIFNIGLIMGVSTLLYFPSVVFILLIMSGLTITRTFKLPEWLIMIFGLLSPYYFLWAYLFISGENQYFLYPTFATCKPMFAGGIWVNSSLILVLFLLISGLFFAQKNMLRLLAQSRKSWSIIYLYLIISFSIPFLNQSPSFLYWFFPMVPAAAIFAAAFLYTKSAWFSSLIHWVFFVLAVIQGFFL